MRYLLTGGAGFIGSHLTDALVARGESVVVLDDLSTGRRENLAHLLDLDAVEFIEGSADDVELVDTCMSGVDMCLHLASAVGVALVVERPLETLLRNVRGIDVVMGAAARHGRRLLFTSTSEVYGRHTQGALCEDSSLILGSPATGRWSYAIAKAFGEALAHGYHQHGGVDATVVRLFNTVGPRQSGAYGMVLPRLVRQALDGQPLTVYGDGRQSRCFIHVLDTVEALLALMHDDRAVGRTFNIGNDIPISIHELAERVIERSGSQSAIQLVAYEDAYADGFEELGRRQPDASLLRELTGWSPQRTLADAIDDTIAYHRAQWTPYATANVA